MDRLEALHVIRGAVEGISRVASRNVAMLDDLIQRHRDMSRIAEVHQAIQAALPAVRNLRDACDRVIIELEKRHPQG